MGKLRYPLCVVSDAALIARLEKDTWELKAGAKTAGAVTPRGGPLPGGPKTAKDRFTKFASFSGCRCGSWPV